MPDFRTKGKGRNRRVYPINKQGTPKRDGSGKGNRANYNRGGCNTKPPKHYPKPDYPYCNKGHHLVEMYNEKTNAYEWDCPICKAEMEEARRQEDEYFEEEQLRHMGY